MPRRKIKLTSKYLEKIKLDLPEEITDNLDQYHIKRISYTDDELEAEDSAEGGGYCFGTISTIAIDSDGDVILPRGIDLKRFEKNPVVLFNHSMNSPIGFAEKVHIMEDRVLARTIFGSTEEAQKVHQLCKDGVLRTHSIGFIATESYNRGEENFDLVLEDLMTKHPSKFSEKNLYKVNRIITKGILLEYSIVTIPSNEEAVIQAIKSLKIEEEVEEVEVVEEIKQIDNYHEDYDPGNTEIDIDDEDYIVEEKVEKEIGIKIKKRANTIKKKYTAQQYEQKKLKDLYISLWGI